MRIGGKVTTPNVSFRWSFREPQHALGLYVIFDIVLNHAGDVFGYKDLGSSAAGK